MGHYESFCSASAAASAAIPVVTGITRRGEGATTSPDDA